MPGLSGAEVASRIRAEQPDQPILFVSGYSETDAVKRTAPDAPLLAKPFRAEALHKAVRGALWRRKGDPAGEREPLTPPFVSSRKRIHFWVIPAKERIHSKARPLATVL